MYLPSKDRACHCVDTMFSTIGFSTARMVQPLLRGEQKANGRVDIFCIGWTKPQDHLVLYGGNLDLGIATGCELYIDPVYLKLLTDMHGNK